MQQTWGKLWSIMKLRQCNVEGQTTDVLNALITGMHIIGLGFKRRGKLAKGTSTNQDDFYNWRTTQLET
jgi:hypothetical protein